MKSLLRLFCSVTSYIIVCNLFYSSCYNHIQHPLHISYYHPLILFLLHGYCCCCLEYKYFFLSFCKQLIFASQKLIVCFFSYIVYECFSFTIFASYVYIDRIIESSSQNIKYNGRYRIKKAPHNESFLWNSY